MRNIITYISFFTLVYSCNLANKGNENQTNKVDTATFSSDQILRENEEYLKDSLIQNETNLDSTEFISSINQDNDTIHLYENVGKFNEGFAAVQLNNKWGYIDKSGKDVVPFKYDFAYDFHEGSALVEIDQKYGFIDKTGKSITQFIYEYQSGNFCEGMSKVKRDGKWGFIDKSGKEVITAKYIAVHDFHEGLAAVQTTVYSDYYKTYVKAWGFIDIYGREVTELKFNIERYGVESSVDDFKDGLAKVKINNKFGFINKMGKEVIPVIFSKVGDFHDGLVWVQIDGNGTTREPHFKYLDKNGNQTIAKVFAIAGNFYNGIAIVGECKEGYGYCANPYYYIDKNGKVVNKKSELVCIMDNCGGRGPSEHDEGCKFGFKDFTGKIIIPFLYDHCPYFYNGIALVSINNKYGYIDETGKKITPIKYDYANVFVGDRAVVFINNKRCIINKEGLELSAFYDEIFNYDKPTEFFPVKENNKWGCIDMNGKIIIPIEYEAVGNKYEAVGKPQEYMISVKLNGKWGFIPLK